MKKQDVFTKDAAEGEEDYQSLESGSSSGRAQSSYSSKGKSSLENKPHFIGKTQENVVQFDENIGLLTPNEVKKLEKYGRLKEVTQSETEHEMQQEILIETMPEDIPIIQPMGASLPQDRDSVLE